MEGDVLLVGCAAGYVDFLPKRARSVQVAGHPSPLVMDPHVVVIGPGTSRPLLSAQHLTKQHPTSSLVIATRDEDYGEVAASLQITPFVPVSTIVAREASEELREAIGRAFTRSALRRAQVVVLHRARRELEKNTLTDKNGIAATFGVLPFAKEDPDLIAFFCIYDANRTAIADVIQRRAKENPAQVALRALGREIASEHEAALERDAVFGGNWQPYVDSLCKQGRLLADSGVTQHAWTGLQLAIHGAVLDFVIAKLGADASEDRALIVGMEKFFSLFQSSVSEGFFAAQESKNRAFAQRERLFRTVVESSADAIISKKLDGTITSWNHGAERIYGYTAEEIVGQNIAALVPGDRRAEFGTIIDRISAGEALSAFEMRRVCRDGREIDVSLTISPIRADDGSVVGASVVGRDVTSRVRALRSLKEKTEQLEHAQNDLEQAMDILRCSNEDLEQFAYIASHDLQEPLRMVTNYMELVMQASEGGLSEQGRRYAQYAIDGARRMKTLVDDLLVFSRASRRSRPLQPCDSAQLVAMVVDNLAVVIAEADAVISCGDLPAIWADPSQLQQVFQNLIGNAIKFCGEVRPHVTLSATQEGEQWRFLVEDNGIGFEEKYAERIFQMFQRLHERGRFGGSGIGLAVSKRIVERHGGRIWAESRLGEGARFFFTIPVVPRQDLDEAWKEGE